jgi:mannose-1-phosphate guanylyltransferase
LQWRKALLGRGCLWNTFVIAGRARTFLSVLESTIPHALKAFQAVADSLLKEEETERAARLYEALPTGDFSREVLTQCPERLAVLRMDDTGWGDLGTPEGALAAFQKTAHTLAGLANPVSPPVSLQPVESCPIRCRPLLSASG